MHGHTDDPSARGYIIRFSIQLNVNTLPVLEVIPTGVFLDHIGIQLFARGEIGSWILLTYEAASEQQPTCQDSQEIDLVLHYSPPHKMTGRYTQLPTVLRKKTLSNSDSKPVPESIQFSQNSGKLCSNGAGRITSVIRQMGRPVTSRVSSWSSTRSYSAPATLPSTASPKLKKEGSSRYPRSQGQHKELHRDPSQSHSSHHH